MAPPLEEQAQLRRYAPGLGPLVLLGGPGTEKQDWAHWMHLYSECRSGPFLPLVQPALDPHRLAQELCGSFAVPSHPHTGKMSWAATVFLPDLQQCPLAVQGHLAAMLSNALSGRPLDEHRLRAKLVVGISTSPVHAVQRGTVHPALLPWLHQVVELAPLRDRIWQLPALVQHCLQEVARLQGGLTPQVSQACWRRLQAYAWPGNVDELRQVIRAACAQARSRRIEEGDLPESVHGENEPNPSVSLAEAEERLLLQTLASHRGNKTATAAALGISRRGLYKKLRRLKQGVESATLPLRQNR